MSDVLKLQLQVEYEINTDGYNMLFVKYDWDLKHGLWCILFWFRNWEERNVFRYLHAWFTNRYGCLCRGYLKLIFFYNGGLNLGDFANSISQWFYDKEWLLILTVTVYYFLCQRRKLSEKPDQVNGVSCDVTSVCIFVLIHVTNFVWMGLMWNLIF